MGSLYCPSLTRIAARWLLYRGKEAKAERALHKILKGSPDSEVLVQEQLAILNKSREEEAQATGNESHWSDLWREWRAVPAARPGHDTT